MKKIPDESTKNISTINKKSLESILQEISSLEEKINYINNETLAFKNLIQIKLDFLISRLTGLNQKMKVKQQSKKAKRLEQKKRGKNYKEPVHLIKSKPLNKSGQEVNDGEKQELKRLYKQAIVHVHPDKLGIEGGESAVKTATDLTMQLNGIYKSGDLEQLLAFFHKIILGNPLGSDSIAEIPTVDSKVRLQALKSKKNSLTKQLHEVESDYLYHVLKTYEDPQTFIDELQVQFEEKILKLEKRTKKI
jgi:hypothetical protein